MSSATMKDGNELEKEFNDILKRAYDKSFYSKTQKYLQILLPRALVDQIIVPYATILDQRQLKLELLLAYITLESIERYGFRFFLHFLFYVVWKKNYWSLYYIMSRQVPTSALEGEIQMNDLGVGEIERIVSDPSCERSQEIMVAENRHSRFRLLFDESNRVFHAFLQGALCLNKR